MKERSVLSKSWLWVFKELDDFIEALLIELLDLKNIAIISRYLSPCCSQTEIVPYQTFTASPDTITHVESFDFQSLVCLRQGFPYINKAASLSS